MCLSQSSFLSTGPQSAFLLHSSEKSSQRRKKKPCFHSASHNPAVFNPRKKLNFYCLSRKGLGIQHQSQRLAHKSALLSSFITSTGTSTAFCYQGSANFSEEEEANEGIDVLIRDSIHDHALQGKKDNNETDTIAVSSSTPSFRDGSKKEQGAEEIDANLVSSSYFGDGIQEEENNVIEPLPSSSGDGFSNKESIVNAVSTPSPAFGDRCEEEKHSVNVVLPSSSLSTSENASKEGENGFNVASSSSSPFGDARIEEENNVDITVASLPSSCFGITSKEEENVINQVSSSLSSSTVVNGRQEEENAVLTSLLSHENGNKDGIKASDISLDEPHPLAVKEKKEQQETPITSEGATESQLGISLVMANISEHVGHILNNGSIKGIGQDLVSESSLRSAIPRLVLFMGSMWDSTLKVLKNNPVVEVVNGWSVWNEKRYLENLTRQADLNPMDAAKQTALLVELNKHSPGAVIKRFEQREHAADPQGVVEYLRALLLTNSISEYLPDDRSGKVSTLPTLFQELKQRATGALDEPSTAPGMTEKHPLHVVMVDAKGSNKSMRFIQELISTCLFMIFFSVMWVMFAALLRKYVNNMGGMGPSTSIGSAASYAPKEYSKDATPEKNTTTFNDVKGCNEAKEELEEIVEYLKDPAKFTRLGGKLPKGVLLTGPPGTGKTLLAKAVAGEAGVPFFYRAGSEFEEMFVGVGARRVRALFQAAKKKAPCIIFIDEIDAVGSTRKQWEGHTKKTLHQLLVEMDGFEPNEGIIVIAATNLGEILDPALTRPGRFDRHIVVPNPDVRGRQEILNLYLHNKPVAEDVDVNLLARGTPGFTGADLSNLVNTAAIKAAIEGTDLITNAHLDFAKDKIMMGSERKSYIPSEESRKLTAYHESGHAVVAFNTAGANPIHKATIVPRGKALGMVINIPEKEDSSISRMQLLARLDTCMGGRVAEEMIFGADHITTGARSDLQNATALARRMVSEYGMSNVVGPVYISVEEQQQSPEMQRNIDLEVVRLLKEAYERASCLLKKHEQGLHALARALLEHETLSSKQITEVLSPFQQTDIIETSNAEIPN